MGVALVSDLSDKIVRYGIPRGFIPGIVKASILLSLSMGIGVLLSAGFVLVLEGSIALLAQWIAPFLGEAVVLCMSGVGSLLIIGLALNVLGVTKLKIMNYLPAIFLPIGLIPLSNWLASLF